MNIAIALNEAFLRYGYVLLTSIFENNRSWDVTVYVLYRGIDEDRFAAYLKLASEYGQKVIPVEVPETMIPSDLPVTDKWTLEIYFRLALPELLPKEAERVLYLDTDVAVDDDLRELYDADIAGVDGDYLIAGSPDISDGNLSDLQKELFVDMLKDEGFHYINSGVIVMNIHKLREVCSIDMLVAKIRELKPYLSAFDQDLINYVFYGRIRYLDARRFNHFARIYYNQGIGIRQAREEHTVIVHYAGPKPWSATNLRTDIELIWWEYAKKTPYYTAFMEELLFAMMERGYENTNEFKYQKYKEQQYLDVIRDSKALIEKLTGQE